MQHFDFNKLLKLRVHGRDIHFVHLLLHSLAKTICIVQHVILKPGFYKMTHWFSRAILDAYHTNKIKTIENPFLSFQLLCVIFIAKFS